MDKLPLLQGFISFFFNSALPYPGNDFSMNSFSFNILFASFIDISSVLFLISLLVIHPYAIFSTSSFFFLYEFDL